MPGFLGLLYCRSVFTSWWRAHRPPAVDVVIAVAFVALGQIVTWGRFENPDAFAGSRPVNAVLSVLFMSALAWRRRAPLAAVCWAVSVYFLSQAVVPHDMTFLTGGVPLILLTASAGYYSPRPRAILAAGVAVVGLLVVSMATPELRSIDAFAWNTAFLLVPWLMARGLREREDRAARLRGELVSERTTKEAALQQAAVEERARIARELHDIVAHSVSVMVVQIGAARMQLRSRATSAEAPLLEAEEVGRQTLEDLRRLLGVLGANNSSGDGMVGSARPQPGLPQLSDLLARTRTAGLDVEMEVAGDPVALPPALDLTAYRIVQEALTNTLRHSGATKVSVRLAYTPTALHIEVVDDGPGAPMGNGAGLGLAGIDQRVSLFGGTSTIGPMEGGGWRVQIELPLPNPLARDHHSTALPAS
jgi:signal transduction histidine kinase